MAFIQARCTLCGGLLAADNDQTACRCPLCGELFIVEQGAEYFSQTVDFINDHVSVITPLPNLDDDFDILRGTLLRYKGEACDVVVPDGVTAIGSDESNGFYGCGSLTSAALPDGLVRISSYAFRGCSCLSSIEIPPTVREIRDGAFYGCSSLVSALLPEGIGEIRERTFYGCSSLRSIVIPAGVREIGNYAFKECVSLSSVKLPDGLERIGLYAFEKCRNLKKVIFPESVREISRGAFDGCEALEEITIKGGTRLAPDAFAGCISLIRVDFPQSDRYAEAFPEHIREIISKKRKRPGR